MAYNKLQFIGYCINTFPIADGAVSHGQRYLGHDIAKQDIAFRCSLLAEVIQQTARRPAVVTAGHTLKIFVVPEFFFRGSEGAYPIENVSQIAEDMRKKVKDAAYANWMFVFGTALGYLAEGTSKEVFNLAVVQRGGTSDTSVASTLLVYKEYISSIDFSRHQYMVMCDGTERGAPHAATPFACPVCGDNPNHSFTQVHRGLIGSPTDDESELRPTTGSRDVNSLRVEKAGEGREATKSGLGGQGYFEMAGITFGLEVCLDHAEKRLRSSPPARGAKTPQVHLIPSGGMSIHEDAVVAGRNGFIFNVDGAGGSAHCHLNKNVGNFRTPRLQLPTPNDSIPPIDALAPILTRYGTRARYFPNDGRVDIFAAQNVPMAETNY